MPWKWPSGRSCPAANPGNELPRREPIAAAPTTSKPAERAREGRAGCQLLLSSAARLAIADLRFAAWFLWMTPLLAALSRLAHAVRMASVASATSPASAASRNLRTAVFSDDLTALLRWRAFSFCLLRLIWDLMFATRKPRSGSGLVGRRGREFAHAAAPHTSAGRIRSDEAGYLNSRSRLKPGGAGTLSQPKLVISRIWVGQTGQIGRQGNHKS